MYSTPHSRCWDIWYDRLNPGHMFCTRHLCYHDDIIKWKHFPSYWPFVRGIHRSPVNSPHKGQWRVALMFSLIFIWINGWVNNREAGDLRRHRAHYDVIVCLALLRIQIYASVILTILGSDNGLLPGWRQAIICTNTTILLIWPSGTNFSA